MSQLDESAIPRRLIAGSAVLIVAVAVALATSPRLVLVAVMVVAVVITLGLTAVLQNRVEPIVWREYRQPVNDPAHADGRVRLLRARLASASSPFQSVPTAKADQFDPTDAIVEGLVEVIDDHLMSEHGIDRTIDPEAAAALLGPELARFVTDPATGRAMTRRNALSNTLALIEDL